jgi:hypothetical protein
LGARTRITDFSLFDNEQKKNGSKYKNPMEMKVHVEVSSICSRLSSSKVGKNKFPMSSGSGDSSGCLFSCTLSGDQSFGNPLSVELCLINFSEWFDQGSL